jgi:threonine dehydrogenase-like Zn-dependent dehydrogenase
MIEVRAAVVTATHKPLEIQKVPVPDLEPRGLLAKVDAATLCGTDVHRWHGEVRTPFIPGHETCGIVEEMNGERTDLMGEPLKQGDRILWAYPACGRCYWCTVARQPSLCRNSLVWGNNPVDKYPYLLGGCAEAQYVPPGSDVIKVPDEVTSPIAAAAACPFRTVMHGYDRLGPVYAHETVLIQGSGPLGIFAAAVAKDQSAYKVLMIGAPAGRLEVGRAMGADDTLNLEDVEAVSDRRQWVLDHTSGRGADVVIQVATTSAIPEGLSLLRPGGRYISIGAGGGGGTPPSMPLNTFPQHVTFISVRTAEPRHWLQAVRFVATRQDLPWDSIISASYKLDDITKAYEAMSTFSIVKPVIFPNQK